LGVAEEISAERENFNRAKREIKWGIALTRSTVNRLSETG
jgi:hypothetical protein